MVRRYLCCRCGFTIDGAKSNLEFSNMIERHRAECMTAKEAVAMMEKGWSPQRKRMLAHWLNKNGSIARAEHLSWHSLREEVDAVANPEPGGPFAPTSMSWDDVVEG